MGNNNNWLIWMLYIGVNNVMRFYVKCVEDNGYDPNNRFTVGKLYLWCNGSILDDEGYQFKDLVADEDPENWGMNQWYKFEKVDDRRTMTVVCISSEFPEVFTVGGIYEMLEGQIKDNLNVISVYRDLEDLNDRCSSKFIRIIER